MSKEESMTVKVAVLIIMVFVGSIATTVFSDGGKQDEILETTTIIVTELKSIRRDIEEIKEDNKKQDDRIEKKKDKE